MRNNEEQFLFVNKDKKKLVIKFNFWYDLILSHKSSKKPKTASSVMVNFNKCLPRHIIEDKILAAFKEFI